MQFRVPKFLEREASIAFGLTFKKLAVLAGLGFGLFVLYYIIPRPLFILLAVLTGVTFLVLTFVKIGGQSLPELLKHSFGFFLGARTYIWQQKGGFAPIKVVRKKAEKKGKEKEAPLKISPKSQLGAIKSRIEFGGRREHLPSEEQ